MEHQLSKIWQKITGDSYVVDAREVMGSDPGYLSKYVAKSFLHTDAFRMLGFHRSWSRSRTWGVERFLLDATVADDWKSVAFTKGREVSHGLIKYGSWEAWVKAGQTSWLRARVGTELARELAHEREDKASKYKILEMLEVLRAGS